MQINLDIETLIKNQRVQILVPPFVSEIIEAEQILGCKIPDLLKIIIEKAGVLTIWVPNHEWPYLRFLGLGPASTVDDNLLIFNQDNPSLPAEFLAFAHEFDGKFDSVYAITKKGEVKRTREFCFPSAYNGEYWGEVRWESAYSTLQEFFDHKVVEYLNTAT
jgi:hypothetical protein